MHRARWLAWPLATAIEVLCARALAYALASPSPVATDLSRAAGGPGLVVVTLAALAVGVGVSAVALWLACAGVQERWRLDPHRHGSAPPAIRVARATGRAGLLWVFGALGFASLESYLHVRAGLGFHGLHCLTGPVHYDALAILAGLSLIASAVWAAVAFLLRWMRRAVATLLIDRRRGQGARQLAPSAPTDSWFFLPLGSSRPRAPPAVAVNVPIDL